jgi:CRP-like cAMP-binding protein
VAEHVIATLGEGDYVGEIGLLEKRPRTATVVATEPSRVLRIPGQDFLRIVNEGPRVSPTLISVMASRLAASQEDLDHGELGRS